MKLILSLLVAGLALNADAVFGPGGPMGGGPSGIPPFVSAKIASKGMMGGMGGLPIGPPSWVTGLVNAKNVAAVEEAAALAAQPVGGIMGGPLPPPAFVQSMIASKALAKPIGPPAWVMDLIDAKNAAAAEEAAALAAQQQAAMEAAQPAPAPSMAGLAAYLQDLIDAKALAAGPFAPAVMMGAATKTPAAGSPPDWIMGLIQANMAAKAAAAKPTPYGASSAAYPPAAPAYNYSVAKRDLAGASTPSVPAPVQQQPQAIAMPQFNPFFAPYPQPMMQPLAPPATPVAGAVPAPMPMMPMMYSSIMPFWKLGKK